VPGWGLWGAGVLEEPQPVTKSASMIMIAPSVVIRRMKYTISASTPGPHDPFMVGVLDETTTV
jgi:hypothetical protein